MLVVSRKTSERIKIGEGATAVWVTVALIGRDKVRLGIDAVPAVKIMREELLEDARNYDHRADEWGVGREPSGYYYVAPEAR